MMEYLRRGQGSSDRAIEAAERNCLPLTKAVPQLCKMAAKINIKLTRKVAREILLRKRCVPTEWHHTGLYGEATTFYDLDHLFNDANAKEFLEDEKEAVEELLKEEKEREKRNKKEAAELRELKRQNNHKAGRLYGLSN